MRVTQKILIVEDNELNLKLFCDLLAAHGYGPDAVRDGREALDRARATMPDLILMDIQLPHVSGLDLIQQIAADPVLNHIPVLAVTAYAGHGDEDRIRQAGARAYISKPITIGRFMEAIRSLI